LVGVFNAAPILTHQIEQVDGNKEEEIEKNVGVQLAFGILSLHVWFLGLSGQWTSERYFCTHTVTSFESGG
jgi:hypothetical protein